MKRKKLFSEIPYLQNGSLTLRKITLADAAGLQELVNSPAVYRYLPTFLYEKKYEDIRYVKISIGYRLLESCWGRGIATGALSQVVRYLDEETDIEIITASTMVENLASANVLRKNGFTLVVHAVGEDWGYENPTITDKWIL